MTGRHRGSGAGLTLSFEYTLVGEGIEEDPPILHRCARECEVDKCNVDARLRGAKVVLVVLRRRGLFLRCEGEVCEAIRQGVGAA